VAQLLSLCERYSIIEDSLALCRLELGELREGPPNIFRVQMNNAEAEKRLATRFPSRESTKIRAMGRPPTAGDDPEIIRLFADIRDRISPLGEGTFTFYRPAVLAEALSVADRTISMLDRTLPTDWSIGPYTLEQFWRFWAVLSGLTMSQRMAATAVIAFLAPACAPLNTPLVEMSPASLIAQVSAISGLTEKVAASIVSDLTYDPQLKGTDIMFQPLVVAGDRCVVMPSIIEGSNAERNLIALWNKKPDRKSVYDTLSPKKEALFLTELSQMFREEHLHVKPRVKIGDLTDADLVVWCMRERMCLIIQAKWLYGPDSILEVLSHDRQLQAGAEQARVALDWVASHPEDFLRRCEMTPGPINGVFACVISKVGAPTCYAFSADIPIVDIREFEAALHRPTRIPDIHRRLLKGVSGVALLGPAEEFEIDVPPIKFVKLGYSI